MAAYALGWGLQPINPSSPGVSELQEHPGGGKNLSTPPNSNFFQIFFLKVSDII